VLKGITAAEQSSNLYGNILGVGLISWIAAEAILNIGAVLGVLPVTGIPLPFISFGGSSLMITMAAAGILVNIARQGGLSKSRAPQTRATPRSSARPRAGAGASRSTTRR
jgi:cell division protein FtsW